MNNYFKKSGSKKDTNKDMSSTDDPDDPDNADSDSSVAILPEKELIKKN